MAKFEGLADYCKERTLREFELPFHKIETLIGSELPASALRSQYWANVVEGTGPVRSVMRTTLYETFLVEGSKRVRFVRKL